VGYVRVRKSGEGERDRENAGGKNSSFLVCAHPGKEKEALCCSK